MNSMQNCCKCDSKYNYGLRHSNSHLYVFGNKRNGLQTNQTFHFDVNNFFNIGKCKEEEKRSSLSF